MISLRSTSKLSVWMEQHNHVTRTSNNWHQPCLESSSQHNTCDQKTPACNNICPLNFRIVLLALVVDV